MPAMMPGALRGRAVPVLLMLVAVWLQIAGAALLKLLADARTQASALWLLTGVAAVAVVNVARLGVWGVAHRRYPLSTVFPLSALFFPAMLALAWWFGDSVSHTRIAGAALITAGSGWIAWRRPE
ncbi:MAG TPA: hypothetical protein VFT98_11940 [Myxococcota bacterium]|nr:hypothetical protein [Myxococcota bacterium]